MIPFPQGPQLPPPQSSSVLSSLHSFILSYHIIFLPTYELFNIYHIINIINANPLLPTRKIHPTLHSSIHYLSFQPLLSTLRLLIFTPDPWSMWGNRCRCTRRSPLGRNRNPAIYRRTEIEYLRTAACTRWTPADRMLQLTLMMTHDCESVAPEPCCSHPRAVNHRKKDHIKS